MPRRRWALAVLALALLLGAGLRGLYLLDLTRAPDYNAPQADADYHNYWARALAFGQWQPPGDNPDPQIRTTPYFRPPGYPYFLGLLYRATGPGYLGPRLLQMALGLLNVCLAFRIASVAFGPAAGGITALLMATYWTFIYFEGEFQEPVLMVLLLLGLILALMSWERQRTPLRAAGAGVLIGLNGLARPSALLLLPAAWVWTYWIERSDGERRRCPATILALSLGALLMILPATIRNWTASRELVPISSNGGINLFMGNNETANGLVSADNPEIDVRHTCYDYPELAANVEARLGRKLSYSELSSYYSGRAFRFMAAHPGRELELLGRRALIFWGPEESSDSKELALERKSSAVLRFDPVGFPPILALGLAGALQWLLAAWRERKKPASGEKRRGETLPPGEARRGNVVPALLLLFLVAWVVSYLPFGITTRYRLPIVPLLILLAAVFLERMGRWFRDRNWSPLIRWGSLLIVAGVLASINFAGVHGSPARWHYQRGIAYWTRGATGAAIAEFRQALEANPNNPSACNDLGAALASSGQMAQSLPYFERAVALKPEDALLRCNLAASLEALGQLPASLVQYQAALSLKTRYGRAQEGLRRVQAALSAGAASGGAAGGRD